MKNYSKSLICLPQWAIVPAICLCALLAPLQAQVVVHEFQATRAWPGAGDSMVDDEYIEFLITEPTTASELADLTFGDTRFGGHRLNSVFQFDQSTLDGILAGAGTSSFLPGTLVVVKGGDLGPQDLGYNPLSATADDHDAWAIELVVDQGFSQVDSAPVRRAMNLDTRFGDVVWIADGVPASASDTSGFIDGLGSAPFPGQVAQDVAAQFGSEALLLGSAPSGSVAVNRGSGGSGPVFDTGSMGLPGDGGAAGGGPSAVEALRLNAVPEPGRLLLLGLAALGVAMRRRR